jgi:hypothetical protein
MTDLLLFVLSLAGFAALLLAMDRHYRDWLGHWPSAARRRRLRLSGFTAIALAFLIAGAGLGWGYGTVAWLGWLSAAAALVVAANLNRARLQRLWRGGQR